MPQFSRRVEQILRELEKRPEVGEQILTKLTTRPSGEQYPIYAWKPLCAPWNPESNCTFQRDLFFCNAETIGILGGNGIGKTETLSCYIAARLRGRIPIFPDVRWPIPQVGWAGCEPDELPKFFERIVRYIPEGEIDRILWARGSEYLRLKNGSELWMKSYGERREGWQGANLNFLALNEEPYEHHWAEGAARLRLENPQKIIAFTPVKGAAYIHDILDLKNFDKYLNLKSGKLALFTASMRDNKTLAPNYVENMIAACLGDEDMIAIRVDGKPIDLRGKHIFGDKSVRDGMEFQHSQVSDPMEWIWFDDAAKPHKGEALNGHWKVWEHPIPRARYAMGADVAAGISDGDYSACFVMNTDTGSIAAVFHGKLEPGDFGQELAIAGRYWNTALLGWEMNNHGGTVYDRLMQLRYPRCYKRQSFGGRIRADIQTYGFNTDKNSKPAIIHDLRGAVIDKKLVIRDYPTIKEMLNFGYIRKEESSARDYGMAALTGHDDLVMALAITWRVAKSTGSPRMERELEGGKSPMDYWLEKQKHPKAKIQENRFRRPLVVR